MAIAFESNTTAGPLVLPMSCNKPAGSVSGDVLVAQCVSLGNAGGAHSSSGWTLAHSQNNTNGSFSVLLRVLDGSEGASFSFTAPTTSASTRMGISRYSGVHSVSPNNASDIGTQSTKPLVAPTVTTTVSDTLVLRIYGISSSTSGVWTVTGTTINWQTANLVNAQVAQASAGATGTQSANYSTTSGNGVGVTLALASAPIATEEPVITVFRSPYLYY